jgi:hypothetical protein
MLRRRPAACIIAAAGLLLLAWLGAARAEEKLAAPRTEEKLAGLFEGAGIGLYYKVPDAVLQKLLPDGWESAPLTGGAWPGNNLYITFYEGVSRENLTDKKGEIFCVTTISGYVRRKGSDQTVAMVLAGLASSHSYVPGPLGVHAFAKVVVVRHFYNQPDTAAPTAGHNAAEVVPKVEEGWQFIGDNGDTMELQIVYARSIQGAYHETEGKAYSGAKPDLFEVLRNRYISETVSSVSTGKNAVQNFVFKASGARLSELFDGSEQLLGVASIPWLSRQIVLPTDRTK